MKMDMVTMIGNKNRGDGRNIPSDKGFYQSRCQAFTHIGNAFALFG